MGKPASTKKILLLATAVSAALLGCSRRAPQVLWNDCNVTPGNACRATQIEEPCVCPDACPSQRSASAEAPLSLSKSLPTQYLDLTLEEVIQRALANTRVLNSLGAALITSPGAIDTVYDPAVIETNPQVGVEAALSAFDARVSTIALGERTDLPLNNNLPFVGDGLFEDIFSLQSGVTKQTAVGSEFSFSHNLLYNANNQIGNLFPNTWSTTFEASFKQPLALGSGVEFNRIAGPNGAPGISSGVLIARVNTDISLADFEAGVRDFVSNLENLYWDLHFAYQNLDAARQARDASLATWRKVNALMEGGRASSVQESQARVQYFSFQQSLQDALAGRLFVGTQTQNGSGGGTFSSAGGVLTLERQLRLLIGMPISDGALIRPADSPVLAQIDFDWETTHAEAVSRRVELRRQRWLVKRRELELIASRNFTRPTIDLVGTYRFRGLGDDLLQQQSTVPGRFDAAFDVLGSGDFQDWQVGVVLEKPLGLRQGHAAVRNAQLQLARERALLAEQERQVVLGVSNAIAELDRAYTVATTNYNLMLAAADQVKATGAAFDAEQTTLFVVLDAQTDLFSSRITYQQSVAEYALAVKNLHYEKGTLLGESDVLLTEGRWPLRAYADASRRQRLSLRKPRALSYVMHPTRRVSAGEFPQGVATNADQPPSPVVARRLPKPSSSDRPNESDANLQQPNL